MSRSDTMERIRKIMTDVFDLDQLTITEATTAKDVEQWDSLSHIRLMVALERAFKIRLNNAEIEGLKDVGDLITCIDAKTSR
jgi:acyl carrier protein